MFGAINTVTLLNRERTPLKQLTYVRMNGRRSTGIIPVIFTLYRYELPTPFRRNKGVITVSLIFVL